MSKISTEVVHHMLRIQTKIKEISKISTEVVHHMVSIKTKIKEMSKTSTEMVHHMLSIDKHQDVTDLYRRGPPC